MLTETDSIKTYQEHLTILPNLDLGIGRIRKLLCWPEEHEPSALAPYLPCLFEYIAFSEGVVIPFFQVLHRNLKKHIYSLYVYLRDNGKEPESFLTHDEAFDFLCALGHSDPRNIIDHYNRLPSNTYTGVINSIHTQDKTAFIAALKETDCPYRYDFLQVSFCISFQRTRRTLSTFFQNKLEWKECSVRSYYTLSVVRCKKHSNGHGHSSRVL